ncbi:MAG: aspartate kinase [Halanaerobiaceae bacterium]
MKKIVQKFGGTSLDTSDKRLKAAKNIKCALDSDFSPIVIVSAMGRLGKPYATDTLLNLAKKIKPEIPAREKDLLMSCGEIISTVIMVQTLAEIGVEASALTGAQAGIETDANFGEAAVLNVNPERIYQLLKTGTVPIIAGFQGITEEGEITTLGRGGSDTTASIVAAAVQALFIEIYTDVEGVMTADPGLVEKARILDKVSYNEVCELAYQGARVLHPRAAEIAMENNIPIKVKSVFSENSGTVIHNFNMRKIKGDKPVTGVASRSNIVFVKITPDNPVEYAKGLSSFNLLASSNISVDFINIRPEAISFVITEDKAQKVEDILSDHDYNYEIADTYVKVSVVGGGMTGRPGVMARIVDALSRENISIYQTTDSHTTISCLIKKEDEKRALNTLHDVFKLDYK